MLKETWVDRFDKEFARDGGYVCRYNPILDAYVSCPEEVKDFISKVREEAVLDERRRISELIKNVDSAELYDGDGETHTGWQQATKHFLALINKDK